MFNHFQSENQYCKIYFGTVACISSNHRFGYHQHKVLHRRSRARYSVASLLTSSRRQYSLWLMIYTFGDDILAFSRYARKKRMIYQVCDLDKKITVFKEAVIFWWTVAPFAHRGLRGKLGFCYSSVGHDE